MKKKTPLPPWLKQTIKNPTKLSFLHDVCKKNNMHTVCAEAKCPNIFTCWEKKHATFLVLGNRCTRSCSFCNIDYCPNPSPPDPLEPSKLASIIEKLQLKHVTLTMVTRDDLADGGAHHLFLIICEIKKQNPGITLEILSSDFQGKEKSLKTLIKANPDIFNHNIETVPSLTPKIRHKNSSYTTSLHVLSYIKKHKTPHAKLKSGLMLGLGEKESEIFTTIKDLHLVGCDIITIGQYLQPSSKNITVKEFVDPKQFKKYEDFGYNIGVKCMQCGPFVRSSYQNDKYCF